MDPPLLIVLIFVLGFALLIAFAMAAFLLRPWLRAVLNNTPVSVAHIIGMRLRGNPPILLIDAMIALTRGGVSTTIAEVEGVYVDNRCASDTTTISCSWSVSCKNRSGPTWPNKLRCIRAFNRRCLSANDSFARHRVRIACCKLPLASFYLCCFSRPSH